MYDESLAPMDPEIRPLCDALNVTGWCRTLESCAGHPGQEGKEHVYLLVAASAPPKWYRVLDWVERAELRRQELPGALFRDDWLITATYEGWGKFRVQGRYVSGEENGRIRRALLDAL